ncbi:hypothetical protein SALBM135S_01981 [Streptomyces alboniger]
MRVIRRWSQSPHVRAPEFPARPPRARRCEPSSNAPAREAAADVLLRSAYSALERPALAAVTGAHHRHRALPHVDVLESGRAQGLSGGACPSSPSASRKPGRVPPSDPLGWAARLVRPVRQAGRVARGNPVGIRDCPAAVSGNDRRHTHWARWSGPGKRRPVGVSHDETGPRVRRPANCPRADDACADIPVTSWAGRRAHRADRRDAPLRAYVRCPSGSSPLRALVPSPGSQGFISRRRSP